MRRTVLIPADGVTETYPFTGKSVIIEAANKFSSVEQVPLIGVANSGLRFPLYPRSTYFFGGTEFNQVIITGTEESAGTSVTIISLDECLDTNINIGFLDLSGAVELNISKTYEIPNGPNIPREDVDLWNGSGTGLIQNASEVRFNSFNAAMQNNDSLGRELAFQIYAIVKGDFAAVERTLFYYSVTVSGGQTRSIAGVSYLNIQVRTGQLNSGNSLMSSVGTSDFFNTVKASDYEKLGIRFLPTNNENTNQSYNFNLEWK